MKKFADENLKPVCSPSNKDLCDDDKKAQIEELEALSEDELVAKITTAEEEMATAEKDFKELVEKLQKKYEKASKKKEDTIKEIKDSGWRKNSQRKFSGMITFLQNSIQLNHVFRAKKKFFTRKSTIFVLGLGLMKAVKASGVKDGKYEL